MSDVGDAENSLKGLANYGLANATSIGALPGSDNLVQQANDLNSIVGSPIDFSQQQALTGQNDANTSALFQLGQQLGVQKAVAAIASDKASKQGRASADTQAANAQENIAQVGQIGQAEQDQLLKSGLSSQSVSALSRLHITAQQLQQQGLKETASNAQQAADRNISLAQQRGAQEVSQAATTAQYNEQALEQQYESQQWAFWGKIASGLLSAAGAVGGLLVGGAAGVVGGGAGAVAGAQLGQTAASALGLGNDAPPAMLNGYQTPTPAIGADTTTSSAASASYTVLPDSLPVA